MGKRNALTLFEYEHSGLLYMMNPRTLVIDTTEPWDGPSEEPDHLYMHNDSIVTAMSSWSNLRHVTFIGSTVLVRRVPGKKAVSVLQPQRLYLFFTHVRCLPQTVSPNQHFTWKVT